MTLPFLLPASSTLDKYKEHTLPSLDFHAVSNAIIDGGADIVFNRFNIGVRVTPQVAKLQLIHTLTNTGAYFHQLETLSEPDHFGVYFELFKHDDGEKRYKLPQGGETSIVVNTQNEENGQSVRGADEAAVKLTKVPDRYELKSLRKWKAAMLLWTLRENVRQSFSPDPVCRGVIVIDPYVFNDEHNLRGNAVIKYAIAARSDYVDLFAKLGALHSSVANYKMSNTSFLMECAKPISKCMKAAALASLKGHVESIGYDFKLVNASPIDAYAALAKEFGYKACGFAWVDSPDFFGAQTNGSRWFDLDNMPRTVPDMGGIQLVNDEGNQIALRSDPFQKNMYSFSLSDLESNIAAEFMARFTSEMGKLGAITARDVNYKHLFSESTSVYLPGFPMAGKHTLSLSYPGDLSPLNKATRRSR